MSSRSSFARVPVLLLLLAFTLGMGTSAARAQTVPAAPAPAAPVNPAPSDHATPPAGTVASALPAASTPTTKPAVASVKARPRLSGWRAEWQRQWQAQQKTRSKVKTQTSGDWRAEWKQQWLAAHTRQARKPVSAPNSETSHVNRISRGVENPSLHGLRPTVLTDAKGSKPIVSGRTLGETPHSEGFSTPRKTNVENTNASNAAIRNRAVNDPSGRPLPGATLSSLPATANRPADGENLPATPPVPAASVTNPLRDTKPDPAVLTPKPVAKRLPTQDNAFAAVNDGGKMVLYLVPMLALMVGSLHLLRRWQERKGKLPAFPTSGRTARTAAMPPRASHAKSGGLMALLQGAKPQPAGAIRLVESVPLGPTNLHLIEVRGKLLLIGATGGSVNLLTEIEDRNALDASDFRTLLQAAAADMDGVDLMEPDLPAVSVAQTLEEQMRMTGQAVTRRARRLRTVREEEDYVV